MIAYVQDCSWRLIKSAPHQIADSIPGLRETWFGRADQLALFLATYPLYLAYQGGYITAVDPNDDQGPFSTCDLTITLPPDFSRVITDPDTSIKTVTLTANVAAASAIPSGMVPSGQTIPAGNVSCQKSASFYSPSTRYSYFANSKPAGPRFSSAGTTASPVIIRSVITVQAPWGALTFGSTAPAAVATALNLSVVDKFQSTEAKQIKGTPWYECVDVVGREYLGDS